MEIDWKKKYNEALEKIKRYTIDKYGCTRLKPADIFPELSENDERMKKAIIDALNSHNNSINLLSSRGYSLNDVISYLEKKEQQEVNCDFYNKELSDIVSAELSKYSGSNSIKSPWALDSTGVQYPLYFANLGAKWQKKQKSVEWNDEDERIRNEILEYFLITRIKDFVAKPERQKWISYIEKQKEQKPISRTEPIVNGLTEFEKQVSYLIASVIDREHEYSEGYVKWVAQSLMGYAIKNQKPAEWSDEDELMRTAVIQTLETFKGRGTTEMQIKWLKSLCPQPKQDCDKYTWSDIDKGILKDAITAADLLGNDENYKKEHPNLAKAFRIAKDWLKSLPKRFDFQTKQKWNEEDEYRFKLLMAMCEDSQNKSLTISTTYREMQETKDWLENRFKFLCLRPKQEWSEEDKEILKSFKFICKKLIENPSGEKFSVHHTYAEKMLKFLESLSPDSKQELTCSWKPSEEQMKDLYLAASQLYSVNHPFIKSLYEDLKKLM